MKNKKGFSTLTFLVAIVVSMAFVSVIGGGIKTTLGQVTNKSSMSGMNMTGTADGRGNMSSMSGMSGMGGGGNMQGMSGMSSMGSGANMQGMSGMSSMGGGGGGNMPGSLNQMCHMGNDMPPHYCEPAYHVMSSAQAIKVSAVSPLNNNSLTVTLQQLNAISNGTTSQKVVLVGGGGSLAGATVVDPGWKT
ncbi:MAG TPA: hypothetical protein VH796_13520, partial [Nitrososphaeraceae archaeon]